MDLVIRGAAIYDGQECLCYPSKHAWSLCLPSVRWFEAIRPV